MADPDPSAHRIAEIRRHVDDLLVLADRLAHQGPSNGTPSPTIARLYAEVEQLAAAVRDNPPPAPRQAPRIARPAAAPEPRRTVPAAPAPSASDYWVG